jgi:hypothetical protein
VEVLKNGPVSGLPTVIDPYAPGAASRRENAIAANAGMRRRCSLLHLIPANLSEMDQ